jgi:flagellar basal-body rod protein FlgB
MPLLNKALDAYSMRQAGIAKNIANATTPGYQPEKVRFEELFQESSVTTVGLTSDEKHIPLGKTNSNNVVASELKANIPEPEVFFSGESHVNIDKEMSELAQNQIRYRFATKAVKAYFTAMQTAIRGAVR